MKCVDLFCGIGGFHEGLEKANNNFGQHLQESKSVRNRGGSFSDRNFKYTCKEPTFSFVWANEWDKYAGTIYQKHFPTTPFFAGDIRTADIDGIPEFDLLCGGFPCQSFSIAGKRKGFDDTRGTLFFEIAKIVERKRPRLVLLENVKGLLSHDRGRTFATILRVLDELGYWVEWEVLNSKNFGVPQNRERVFIIGHSRTARPRSEPVFPLGQDDEIIDAKNERRLSSAQSFRAITSTEFKQHGDGNYIVEKGGELMQLNEPSHSNERVYGEQGLSPSLNTMQGGNRQPKILHTNIGKHISERETSVALRSGASHNYQTIVERIPKVLAVQCIRRLMPVECERLQGFSDGWTEGISDSQRYKCLGNAVTVNVVQAIGEKILEQEAKKE